MGIFGKFKKLGSGKKLGLFGATGGNMTDPIFGTYVGYKSTADTRKLIMGPDLSSTAAGRTPELSDAEVQQAGEEERRRLLNARGRASTILTGGQGLALAASTASRTLFGGG